MRIHKTGHDIADIVAEAFIAGNYKGDADLVYGILRHNVFKESDNWLEVDKGYFNPGHYDGYYRISYKGTQAKWHEDIPKQDIDFKPKDWIYNPDGYILICPPTEAVIKFFDLKTVYEVYPNAKIRRKDDTSPIEWDKISAVETFNSSIGWQALQRGIPCVSDSEHSIVGSYYKHELDKLNLDYTFENVTKIDRKPLFKAMKAHQFTLKEISEGKAQCLIKHYLKKS